MDDRQPLSVLCDLSIVVAAVGYGLLLTLAALVGLAGLLVPVEVYAILAEAFAFALRCLLWLSIWRHGYHVLRAVAQGHRELPTPDVSSLHPLSEPRLVAHFFTAPAIIGVLLWLEPGPAFVRWLLVIALAGAVPASAAVLALTGSLSLAVSPRSLVLFMQRQSFGYARLLALCALLGAVVVAARAVPWPLAAGLFVVSTIDVWACLGVFALTGRSIREHRLEFAVPGEVESEEERTERSRLRAREQMLDRAYASFRSGLVRAGFASLEELMTSEGHSLSVYDWVFSRMRGWDRKYPALEIGRHYIDRLLAESQAHDALEVFARCRQLSDEFRPTPESGRALAEYARSINQHGRADDLSRFS